MNATNEKPVSFTEGQVDTAIDAVAEVAKQRGKNIAYADVFAAAELPPIPEAKGNYEPAEVSEFMEAFHWRCVDRGLPPLDSLVVNVSGPRKNRCGPGYFKINYLDDPFSQRTNLKDAMASTKYAQNEAEECWTWGEIQRKADD